MSDSLGHALLFPADMEHYTGYRDDHLVLKLKWHTIVVSFSSPKSIPLKINKCCLSVGFHSNLAFFFSFPLLFFHFLT